MEKLRYSEIFYSVQGEGRFVGVPSVFFRVFGCNFNCHGFGQGRDKSKWLKPEEMPYMTQDLSHVKHVRDLPVVEIGCDASASWASRYKHLVNWDSVEEIAQKVTQYTPNHKWTNDNGSDIHFIITGGEPMLWQRETQQLLRQPEFTDLKNLTIETKYSKPTSKDFYMVLQQVITPKSLCISHGPLHQNYLYRVNNGKKQSKVRLHNNMQTFQTAICILNLWYRTNKI